MWIFDLRSYVVLTVVLALMKAVPAFIFSWWWLFSPILFYIVAGFLIIIVIFGMQFYGFNLFEKRYTGKDNLIKIDF